jgi:hypothetical protein
MDDRPDVDANPDDYVQWGRCQLCGKRRNVLHHQEKVCMKCFLNRGAMLLESYRQLSSLAECMAIDWKDSGRSIDEPIPRQLDLQLNSVWMQLTKKQRELLCGL